MSFRIALGYILQETNTFSPLLTRLEDFQVDEGGALAARYGDTRTEAAGFLNVLGNAAVDVRPLLAATATTGGRIRRTDYRRLREMFVRHLESTIPVDGVLLALHGAMAAEETDDTEGDLLRAVRELVGPNTPIVATLDLHANVTEAMASSANALVGYRTWPHIDHYETGVAGAELLLRSLVGEVRPSTVLSKLPMIVPAENMHTSKGPMAEVFGVGDYCREQNPAILSTSVFGVQPWMDIAEMGCATVTVTDGNTAAGMECAQQMARRFWENRRRFDVKLVSPAEAVETTLAAKKRPVVFGESSDSPSAGAPGDSAELLRLLMQRCPEVDAAIWICDPRSVDYAWRAGKGALIHTAIGGAFDRIHHQPVPVDALVENLSSGDFVLTGAFRRGAVEHMGRSAVLQIGKIGVIVSERPVSNISADLFRSQGIHPERQQIVVVKSAGGFRAEYEAFAGEILMTDTPGICTANLKSIPYQNIPRPMYPLDDIVFARS